MIGNNISNYHAVLNIPHALYVRSFLPIENIWSFFLVFSLLPSSKVDDTHVISHWLAKGVKFEGVDLDPTMRKNF